MQIKSLCQRQRLLVLGPVSPGDSQGFCSLQVLCPRCEIGNVGSPKRKAKKGKESPKSNKKKTSRFNTLSDVEKALSETTDSTSAVSIQRAIP